MSDGTCWPAEKRLVDSLIHSVIENIFASKIFRKTPHCNVAIWHNRTEAVFSRMGISASDFSPSGLGNLDDKSLLSSDVNVTR